MNQLAREYEREHRLVLEAAERLDSREDRPARDRDGPEAEVRDEKESVRASLRARPASSGIAARFPQKMHTVASTRVRPAQGAVSFVLRSELQSGHLIGGLPLRPRMPAAERASARICAPRDPARGAERTGHRSR